MYEVKGKLYIAYGSNMNLEQMAWRCPTANVVGTTYLQDWRLIFCGVASIERFKGGQVPVVVWDIQPEDEIALDRYEGWPRLYRKEIVQITLDGKKVKTMVYIKNDSREHPPNLDYLGVISEGYKSAGFDGNYLIDADIRSCMKDRK
jgi:hypothetical protein